MAATAQTGGQILGQVALSYSPIIDRSRNVMATRLAVFPLRPGGSLPLDQLLEAIQSAWPDDGPVLVLSVRCEDLLTQLLHRAVPSNFFIEVPTFMAADPAWTPTLQTLAENGTVMLLSGRPDSALSVDLLKCFRYALIDGGDDRRVVNAAGQAQRARHLSFLQCGVHSLGELEAAFARGAAGVVGWPIEPVVHTADSRATSARPDLNNLIQLMSMVDRGESVDRLERQLSTDPALAYKLMRYLNSPMFGLSIEVDGFAHAIRMVGYQRLKRWLALLLVTADSDRNMRPLMFAAVRRGLIMERLADISLGEGARSDMFVCGVFSLLDQLVKEPFDVLLRRIPVAETIFDALAEQRGALHPMIHLTRTMEGAAGVEVADAVEDAMLPMREVNLAMLAGLAAGLELD